MAGDSMLCKSREMAKFQPLQFSACRVTVGRIQLSHLPTAAHSYLNMDTLNTEAKKPGGHSGKPLVLDALATKGKAS